MLKPKHLFPMAYEALKIAGGAVGRVALGPFKGGWAGLGKRIEEPPTPARISLYNSDDPHEHDADFKE